MPLEVVTIDLIEGGNMVNELNAEFLRLQRAVIDNFNNHGIEAMAKGKIKLEIEIGKAKDYDSDWFNMQYKIGSTYPSVTSNNKILACAEDGRLKAQISGASKHNPKQESLLEPGDGLNNEEIN